MSRDDLEKGDGPDEGEADPYEEVAQPEERDAADALVGEEAKEGREDGVGGAVEHEHQASLAGCYVVLKRFKR